MKRKSLYAILFAPILLFLLALAVFPIFRTEFIHNVRSAMGYEEKFGNEGLSLAPGEDDDPGYSASGEPIENTGEANSSDAADPGSDNTDPAEPGTGVDNPRSETEQPVTVSE